MNTPTIWDIRRANAAAGFHYFDRPTMRFFDSRVLPTVHTNGHRVLFVTSERDDHRAKPKPRLYTVREFDPTTARIDTVGDFQGYTTARQAHAAARAELAATACDICAQRAAFQGVTA